MSNQRRFALIGRGFGSDGFDEYAQDLVGALFVDSSEINFTYTDATPSITAALIDASITFARLQNFDALSVLGRAANSSGVSDEIAAGANDRLLRRTSDTLNFGQLTAGMFPNTVVPDAALSSNVPLKNVDNLWSEGQTIAETVPYLRLSETDQGVDAKSWNIIVSGSVFSIFTATDAGSSTNSALRFTRTGTTVDEVELNATTFDFNGNLDVSGTSLLTGDVNCRGIVYVNPDPQTVPANSVNADARLVLVDNAAISIQQLVIGTGSLGYRFVGASGTFGTPTAVDPANQTYIGFIGAGGYDGTNWQTASAGLIGIRPTAVWSGTSRPTRVVAETTAQSSTTRTRRWFVDDNGEMVQEFGLRLTGTITPTQLAANTDDWNPTSLADAVVIRASTDASRNLTGIVAPSDGRVLILYNVGSQDLVLVHDATSTAANRFLLPNSANLTLNPNDSVTLWYDTTSDRWRPISGV